MSKVSRSVLKNAAPFNWYRDSQAPEVKHAVSHVYALVSEAGYKRAPKHPGRVREHIQLILLNCFATFLQDVDRWVFYPRENAFLDSLEGISANVFVRVVDTLSAMQLIEDNKASQGAGHFDPETNRPLRSRMRATPALIALMQKAGVRLKMVRSRLHFPTIRLRDGDEDLPLPKAGNSYRRLKEMRRALEVINSLLSETFIGLHITDQELRDLNTRLANDRDKVVVDLTQKQLYRVFSARSFERNGRFTGGWWQSLPSEFRPHIYIGSPSSKYAKATAEADFSSMFPSIAYGLLGLEMGDTAYQLDDRPLSTPIRKIVKRVLLTMLMTENAEAARKAVHKAVSDEIVAANPSTFPTLLAAKKKNLNVLLPWSECAPQGCPNLREIIDAMRTKHAALQADFLFKPDQGLYLMYRESQIAERVLVDMAAQNIPVLPIHDSFIATTGHVAYEHEVNIEEGVGGTLDSAMRRAFRDELGVACKVTFDMRENQLPLNNGAPRIKDAPDWDELDGQFDKDERERYATYVRHHEDWYAR